MEDHKMNQLAGARRPKAKVEVSIEPEFQGDEYLFLADKFVYSKKAAAN
jgi:hypothetical protein